jgi:hypothetical protein
MKRLGGSLVIGLVLWLAATAVLWLLWLPPACEGCGDDLGAGILAVMIATCTLFITATGVVVFNVAAWILGPPAATRRGPAKAADSR